MFSDLLGAIPPVIFKFLLVAVSSLLIGLEQRRHYIRENNESQFGTDRTFTLIGILGFILYVIAPETMMPFLAGGVIVGLLLAVFYLEKIRKHNLFGLTSIVTALITYSLAPLVYRQPEWFVLLVVVLVLVLTELKEQLFEISRKFDSTEFITLAKFLLLAGVILPILPDTQISPQLNFSPYKLWLAIVAVAGISYLSYLLKKFIFPDSGMLLTGILGGLYSSTASTIILARKSHAGIDVDKISAAIFLATGMMYLRILMLAAIFNATIAVRLSPFFGGLALLSISVALYLIRFRRTAPQSMPGVVPTEHTNPLEFRTSVVFGGLFVLFALLTGYVIRNYGEHGIRLLSLVVGVTDIDPFIMNLFQNKWGLNLDILVTSVLLASSSNNALKMLYALILGNKSMRIHVAAGFLLLIVGGLVCVWLV
jgi:uncharacterized membrane protein (DUF4010 family)